MLVLVLNAGSSSLKASILETAGLRTLHRAETALGADATSSEDRDQRERALLDELRSWGSPIEAVGHRVVHGGAHFRAPVRIDDRVLSQIEALKVFAPLHNGVAAATIRMAQQALPDLPHFAAFDTAFHSTLEEVAFLYPVPASWYRQWGVRRFGFHGLSVAWSVQRAGELLHRPASELHALVAHLGSGCSVTAVAGGRSVATSMGLTPLEGLMMGTRAGSIDPGVMLYLLKAGHLDTADLEEDLDHRSGLLGVAGSADMRQLVVDAASGDDRARLAIDMFVQRAAAGIAAMATALPRLDALVFTGGIGENAGEVRVAIVQRLSVLGLPAIGAVHTTEDAILTTKDEPIAVLRVEAREDAMIAQEVARILGETP